MIRELLDRLNPTRHLPKPMRRYLSLPNYLFLGWLAVSAALAFSLPSGSPPQEPTQASSEGGETVQDSDTNLAEATAPEAEPAALEAVDIRVSGAASFSLKTQGGKLLIESPGAPPMQLVDGGDGPLVQTAEGKTVYRIKRRADEQDKIYDGAGNYRYRLKCETDEGDEVCKLYDGQGTLLNRAKVKADSFNIYGSGPERLYKGKLKDGSYGVKSEAGEKYLAIRGVTSLKEAALLSLPVDAPLRALLWRAGGRSQ